MAGWIKLWRKLIENGHLKMPGTAFKLWIYCLLEAAPYPDYKQNLDAGELWLSYQRIKDNLAEVNKNVSKSTISAALKYLEQHGYIKLYPEKFKGIRVKVINWAEYQVLAYSAAAESSVRQKTAAASSHTAKPEAEFTATPTLLEAGLPTTLGAAGSNLPTVPTAPDAGPTGTLTVLDPSSPGTLSVPDKYSHSTRRVLSEYSTGTPTVLDRASEPYGHKASSAPKNTYKNTNKNIYPVVVIASDFEQEFCRPLSPMEINQLSAWLKTFPAELIKEALARATLQDKRSIAYIGGILKNWQQAGITTVEEARSEKTRPGTKGGKRNARGKAGYRPNEVDWANEPDTL